MCFRFQDAIAEQPCAALEMKTRQQEDGAVLALLKEKSTGRVILAASVHLYFHPDWPDLKALQAQALCHQVYCSGQPLTLSAAIEGP